MFDNIGGKLKGLAKVLFCVGSIAIFFGVIAVLDDAFLGPIIAGGVVAIVATLVSSWVLYGLGELIENTQETNRLLKTGFSKDIAEEAAIREKAKQDQIERVRQAHEAREQTKAAYWAQHRDEQRALLEKREQAQEALAIGSISNDKRQELNNLIRSIDYEFEKDR